jgi:hypothetical protein
VPVQGLETNLDSLASSAFQHPGNHRPPPPLLVMLRQNQRIFFFGVRTTVDGRVQMVEPSLPALLGCSAWNLTSNHRPVLPASGYKAVQVRILFGGPLTFLETRLQYFGPALQALSMGAAGYHLRYTFPVARTILVNGRRQQSILFGGPFSGKICTVCGVGSWSWFKSFDVWMRWCGRTLVIATLMKLAANTHMKRKEEK